MELTAQDAGTEQGRPLFVYRDGITDVVKKVTIPVRSGSGETPLDVYPPAEEALREVWLKEYCRVNGFMYDR